MSLDATRQNKMDALVNECMKSDMCVRTMERHVIKSVNSRKYKFAVRYLQFLLMYSKVCFFVELMNVMISAPARSYGRFLSVFKEKCLGMMVKEKHRTVDHLFKKLHVLCRRNPLATFQYAVSNCVGEDELLRGLSLHLFDHRTISMSERKDLYSLAILFNHEHAIRDFVYASIGEYRTYNEILSEVYENQLIMLELDGWMKIKTKDRSGLMRHDIDYTLSVDDALCLFDESMLAVYPLMSKVIMSQDWLQEFQYFAEELMGGRNPFVATSHEELVDYTDELFESKGKEEVRRIVKAVSTLLTELVLKNRDPPSLENRCKDYLSRKLLGNHTSTHEKIHLLNAMNCPPVMIGLVLNRRSFEVEEKVDNDEIEAVLSQSKPNPFPIPVVATQPKLDYYE